MSKIDVFIDSLYEHVNGSDKEIAELKQEMKAHLLETVNDLQAQGKSEEESIDIALERFGDRKHLASGLLDLFKVQKRYALTLLRIGFVSLVLSLVTWAAVSLWDNYNRAWPTRLTQEILTVINQDSGLSEAKRKQLNIIVDKYHTSKSVAIYKTENIKKKSAGQKEGEFDESHIFFDLGAAQYVYPPNTGLEYPAKFGKVGQHDDKWWVEVRYRVIDTGPFYRISIGLFIVALAILVIWLVTNAYYKKIKHLTV